jgi:hypothetical protein
MKTHVVALVVASAAPAASCGSSCADVGCAGSLAVHFSAPVPELYVAVVTGPLGFEETACDPAGFDDCDRDGFTVSLPQSEFTTGSADFHVEVRVQRASGQTTVLEGSMPSHLDSASAPTEEACVVCATRSGTVTLSQSR